MLRPRLLVCQKVQTYLRPYSSSWGLAGSHRSRRSTAFVQPGTSSNMKSERYQSKISLDGLACMVASSIVSFSPGTFSIDNSYSRTVRALQTSHSQHGSLFTRFRRRTIAAGASGVEITCCLLLDMFRIAGDLRRIEGSGRKRMRGTREDLETILRLWRASMQGSGSRAIGVNKTRRD